MQERSLPARPTRPLANPGRSVFARALALAVTATALALSGVPASADVRIVSLKSDNPAIAITSATSGGTALKSVGKSDTSLFVEAGAAGKDFACQQTLAITLSNGRSLSRSYDLCAANYTLTVETAAATRPAPPKTAPAETVSSSPAQAKKTGSGRIERKLVMIQTDDDTAIREVFIDDRPAQVRRRSQARVFVEVEGNDKNDGQIDCRRPMRLVLADGRILQDTVDICGDWKVTMSTKAAAKQQAGGGNVRRAVPSTAGPAAPPLAGGVRRPTTSGGADGSDTSGNLRGSRDETARTDPARREEKRTGEETEERTETAENARDEAPAGGRSSAPHDALALPLFDRREWYVSPGQGDTLRLVYGIRETDDRGFLATCERGSNQIETSLLPGELRLAENAPVDVALSARDITRRYTGRGSSANNESGRSMPLVRLAADDPIWSGLARGEALTVALQGSWRYRVSLSGSAGPVRAFQQACATPAPAVADTPGPTRGLPVAGADPQGPTCADEGFITSVPSDLPATMVFENRRQRPIVVHWINFDGLRETDARVPPGGRMVQQTLAGHPWLVSTSSGRCLGMYLARGRSRTVTITSGQGGNAPVASGPIAPPPPAPFVPGGDLVELSYDCDSGAYLSVTIDNDRQVAIVREQGLSPVTLADRSGGGVDLYYADRGYVLSGSGNRVNWQRPGSPPQYCRVF
ncbi:hypothetical protein [Stappia sp.]|uniref:VHL beta domain-containing protein n=1 Tax=Stappia sp. TaxID=1870903 RepID=UPI003A99F9AF